MQPWLIGNTTIRNPYRLRGGLRLLRSSQYSGSLLTHEEQAAFWHLLHDSGVVETEGGNADAGGRKWRAALHQLGFITYEVSPHLDELGRDPALVALSSRVKGLSGLPYEITPNGTRLAEAQTTAEEYESFLRALVAYQIPSVLEKFSGATTFAPLFIVLGTLHGLERAGKESRISNEEMCSIVQFTQDHAKIDEAVSKIIDYRNVRAGAVRKDRYDAEYLQRVIDMSGWGKQPRSAITYVDANFRYLKATGLFSSKGRGIIITPEKKALTEELASSFQIAPKTEDYLTRLYNGAQLPTDSAPEAAKIVHSLAQLFRKSGEEVTIPGNLAEMAVEEVNQVRHRLEARYEHAREETFAAEQRNKWEDVLKDLSALIGGGRNVDDAPARLEWAVWRAFLAIDTLVNKPWQSRRFKVDTDFLPISTAPGGGPDTVFEFEDFVLVVEVTLTTSSRQEAAEGETVRRHVATEVEAREASGKEVLGLFIADKIDSNTAEIFRHGTWFRRDDSKLNLDITPLTIGQFACLFEAYFRKRGVMTPDDVRQIVTKCRTYINREGPEWKARIVQEVNGFLQAV